MDNNNFEQQFTKNVQQAAATQSNIQPNNSSNTSASASPLTTKMPWIIIASLSLVIILQVIILIVVLTNLASNSSEVAEEEDIDTTDITYNDPNATFDSEGLLTATNTTCTNDNGTYTFTTDGKYTFGSQSGTYTITNGNLITLDGDTNHILYYDIINLADGLTIYNCAVDTDTEEPTE